MSKSFLAVVAGFVCTLILCSIAVQQLYETISVAEEYAKLIRTQQELISRYQDIIIKLQLELAGGKIIEGDGWTIEVEPVPLPSH